MIKRFVFIGAAFVGVAFFVSYLGTGKKPELSVPKVPDISIPQSWRNLPAVFSEKETVESEYKVYKWQDEDGVWHFDEVPAGEYAEELMIEPVNTIDYSEGLPVVVETQDRSSQGSGQTPNPYSADGIQDLLKKAQDVQKVLDERAAQQQSALDDL